MSKKRIGFIDFHIDEWHANNYPAWFAAAKRAEEFELGHAWEESPAEGGKPLAEWCGQFGMTPAASIAEVVEKSDAICVLAPSNPEVHARLSDLPLRAGKPLYIDKTFAPDRVTAEMFFDIARRHGTPLMSSSALRYGEEFTAALAGTFAKERPDYVATFGGGSTFQEYAIHQIEMVVAALGTGAESVMRVPGSATPHFLVRYADGVRGASLTYGSFGFSAVLTGRAGSSFVLNGTKMFEHLLDDILDFYTTGVSPIPESETIEVAAIREAAVNAEREPGVVFTL